MDEFVFSFSRSSFFSESYQWVWNITTHCERKEERKGESGWFLVSPEGPSLPRSPYRQAKHSEKVGLPKLETAWGAGAFSVTIFWPWNRPVTPLSLSVLPSSPTAWLLGGRGGTLCDKCPCWRYGTLPCSAARACACLCLFILFVSTAFFYLSEIWTFLCPAFLSCLPSWLVLSCLFQRVSDKPHQVCASPHVRACLVLPPLSSETLSGTLESLHGKSFSFFLLSPAVSRTKTVLR